MSKQDKLSDAARDPHSRSFDALLRDWPAVDADNRPLPPEGDAGWEARAERIIAAARSESPMANVELLLGAPNLPAEPGEAGAVQHDRASRCAPPSASRA